MRWVKLEQMDKADIEGMWERVRIAGYGADVEAYVRAQEQLAVGEVPDYTDGPDVGHDESRYPFLF